MSADPDLIAVEDDQGVPPVAILGHGSMEAASSERVTATRTAFNDLTRCRTKSPRLLADWVGTGLLRRMRAMPMTMRRRTVTSGCGRFSCMRWNRFPAEPRAMIRAVICRGTDYSASGDFQEALSQPRERSCFAVNDEIGRLEGE
jgi:hypothetical protein